MTRRAGCGPPWACLEPPSQSQKEKGKTLSGPPSTTRAVRHRASGAGSPPSSAEVGDLAQWAWTREVVAGEKGTGDGQKKKEETTKVGRYFFLLFWELRGDFLHFFEIAPKHPRAAQRRPQSIYKPLFFGGYCRGYPLVNGTWHSELRSGRGAAGSQRPPTPY